jgi:hypothetical protein
MGLTSTRYSYKKIILFIIAVWISFGFLSSLEFDKLNFDQFLLAVAWIIVLFVSFVFLTYKTFFKKSNAPSVYAEDESEEDKLKKLFLKLAKLTIALVIFCLLLANWVYKVLEIYLIPVALIDEVKVDVYSDHAQFLAIFFIFILSILFFYILILALRLLYRTFRCRDILVIKIKYYFNKLTKRMNLLLFLLYKKISLNLTNLLLFFILIILLVIVYKITSS